MNTAELEQELGRSRDSIKVTSNNRGMVKRWLTHHSATIGAKLEAATVRSLPLAELQACIDSDMNIRVLAKAGNDPAPQPEDEQPKAETKAEDQPKQEEMPMPQQAAAPSDAITAQLTQAISGVLGTALAGQSQVDEARLIELIRQHAPVQRVEIKAGDKEAKALPGRAHKLLPALLKATSATIDGARLNVWLTGPAGSGKSTLAAQVAEGLGLPFYATGAVHAQHNLLGFIDAKGQLVRTPFRDAWENGGVFLLDEVDASNPQVLTTFNQALANGVQPFPDGMVEKHPDFIAIAAANTWGTGANAEYVGRSRLDAATLDRFVFFVVDYDEDLERELAGVDAADWCAKVQAHRKAAAELQMKVVVSPRATLQGAALLAAGLPEREVADAVIYKGMEDDTRARLKSRAKDIYKGAA